MIPLVAPTYTDADHDTMRALTMLRNYDDEGIVREFEAGFAAYVGCRGGVAVNSGTNALAVLLRALEPEPNETILVPSFSCHALLNAVYQARCVPVLVDNICDVRWADFSADVDTGPELLVLPHMFGTDAGTYPHRDVVEDITMALGAFRQPDLAVVSFNRDKMMSTGRGGMIVAQDQDLLARCRELAYYESMNGNGYRPGFSVGMTAMQAALGRSQLRQLPGFIERRREIAGCYTQAFTEAGIECPNPDVDSVFFRYIIGVDDPADKVARLGEVGIEAGRGVNPPLHRLLGLDPDQFPGAEECFSKLLSVPVHPSLTDEQVGYITEQVIQVCAP